MKGKIIPVAILFLLVFLYLGDRSNLGTKEVAQAQSDEKSKRNLERDLSIPKEKIEQAYAEAEKIKNDLISTMGKKLPKMKLSGQYASHLVGTSPGTGRYGATLNDISWQDGRTNLMVVFSLGFSKEEALSTFGEDLRMISMGEFFAITGFGDKAVLVKNVNYNQKNTDVGLHFVKGRAKVDVYISNFKRPTSKNETELLAVSRIIEPLIVARADFSE